MAKHLIYVEILFIQNWKGKKKSGMVVHSCNASTLNLGRGVVSLRLA